MPDQTTEEKPFEISLLNLKIFSDKFEKEGKRKLEKQKPDGYQKIIDYNFQIRNHVVKFIEERKKILNREKAKGTQKAKEFFGFGGNKQYKIEGIPYTLEQLRKIDVNIAPYLQKVTNEEPKEIIKNIFSYRELLSPTKRGGRGGSGGSSGDGEAEQSDTGSPSSSDPIADTLTMIDGFDILGLLGTGGTLPENLIREQPEQLEQTEVEKIFEVWLNEIKKKAEEYKQKKKDEFEDSEKEEIYSYTMNRKQNQERVLKKQKEIAIKLIFSPLVAIATDFKNYDNDEVKKIIAAASKAKALSSRISLSGSLNILKKKIDKFYNQEENKKALEDLEDNRGFKEITEFKPGSIEDLKDSLLEFERKFQAAKEKIKMDTPRIEIVKKIIQNLYNRFPLSTEDTPQLQDINENWFRSAYEKASKFISGVPERAEKSITKLENLFYQALVNKGLHTKALANNDDEKKQKKELKRLISASIEDVLKKEEAKSFAKFVKEVPGFLKSWESNPEVKETINSYIKAAFEGENYQDQKKAEKIANLLHDKFSKKILSQYHYFSAPEKDRIYVDYDDAAGEIKGAFEKRSYGFKGDNGKIKFSFTKFQNSYTGSIEDKQELIKWTKKMFGYFEALPKYEDMNPQDRLEILKQRFGSDEQASLTPMEDIEKLRQYDKDNASLQSDQDDQSQTDQELQKIKKDEILKMIRQEEEKDEKERQGLNLDNKDMSGIQFELRTDFPDSSSFKKSNLSSVVLKDSRLYKANLEGANLSGADLRQSNLREANLSGAKLSGATLSAAFFKKTNFTNADLSDADLAGSSLIGANLIGANLENTNLTETLYDMDTTWPEGFDLENSEAEYTLSLNNEEEEIKKEVLRDPQSSFTLTNEDGKKYVVTSIKRPKEDNFGGDYVIEFKENIVDSKAMQINVDYFDFDKIIKYLIRKKEVKVGKYTYQRFNWPEEKTQQERLERLIKPYLKQRLRNKRRAL